MSADDWVPKESADWGADEAASEAARASSSTSIVDVLLSTTPNVAPDDARGLSTSAGWEAHLECAFLKMTGSDGMPAVGHLLMVAYLWLVEGELELDADVDADVETSPEPSPGAEGP